MVTPESGDSGEWSPTREAGYGLTIDSQKLKLAVTSQQSCFSSSGAESGSTRNASVLLGDAGGATQKADLDRFFGSGITAPRWVTPENLQWNVGDATPKADLVHTFGSGIVVRKMGRPGKGAPPPIG